MKVLHVITSLHFGGAEKLMVDLLPRLCNSEDKLICYCSMERVLHFMKCWKKEG